ncbi:MAG: hypothetical protein UFA98_08200 [Ruminococcus sp.]|nr:hypothetical protein [Ruminococcus sp.]
MSDDESNFYVNEVIDCGGQFDSFSYLENLTGKRIFKEYTYADFEDYVSRKNRREKLASTSSTNTDANRRRSYGSQKRDRFANKKSVNDSIKDRNLAAVHNLSIAERRCVWFAFDALRRFTGSLSMGKVIICALAENVPPARFLNARLRIPFSRFGIMKKRTPATGILFMAERRGFEPLVR